MKIWGLQWKYGVSYEKIAVSNKNPGVSKENLLVWKKICGL